MSSPKSENMSLDTFLKEILKKDAARPENQMTEERAKELKEKIKDNFDREI